MVRHPSYYVTLIHHNLIRVGLIGDLKWPNVHYFNLMSTHGVPFPVLWKENVRCAVKEALLYFATTYTSDFWRMTTL